MKEAANSSGAAPTDRPKDDTALGLGLLLRYGLPALPLALLTLPVYVYVPAVYSAERGLALGAVGAVLLAVRLFDAITDPIIGYASDRLPVFGYRRKTYFALSIPLVIAASWMLMRPPETADLGYLALWSAALTLGWTLAIIPYSAWGAEMTGDYDARNRVTAAREALVVAGTVIATALPAILPQFGLEGPLPVLAAIAVLIAVLYPLAGLVLLVSVPEPKNFGWSRVPVKEGLALMNANGPFKRLIAAFILNGFANGLPASLFLFFTADRLQAGNAQGLLLLIYFLFGVLFIPLWIALARMIGKHRTWCIAMLMACAAFIWVPVLEPGDIALFAIICVVSGAALGADLTLPASIQADVIDADTARGGEQRSALYFAAWSVATKLSLALSAGVALPLLDFAGYEPGGGTATGLLALAVLYALVPTAFKLLAIALMWRFPIDRAAQQQLRAEIAAHGPVNPSASTNP